MNNKEQFQNELRETWIQVDDNLDKATSALLTMLEKRSSNKRKYFFICCIKEASELLNVLSDKAWQLLEELETQKIVKDLKKQKRI